MPAVELPLFPLSVVLFPDMILPLHVGEAQYVAMVEEQLNGSRRFGVVLAKEPAEPGGAPELHEVGTVARIEDSRRQGSAGPIFLLAVGEERFRVISAREQDGLLVGTVETLIDDPATAAETEPLASEVSRVGEEFLRLLQQAAGVQVAAIQLPDEPVALSLALASQLRVPDPERQELLELTDTRRRLERVGELLRPAVANLQHRLAIHEEAQKTRGGNGRLGHEHITRDVIDKLGD